MPDIGLQTIQRQDDTALRLQQAPQPPRPGQTGGQQLVVAIQQVGDAALGNLEPALA